MAPRAHWKGTLKLSLVSCPIALYPAISAAERISFRQVNRQTGNRLRQQLVDTVTGEVVASGDKGRGYEVADDQFVVVRDEELEAARQEARTRPFGASTATINPAPQPSERPAPRTAVPDRREAVKREAARVEGPPAVAEPAPTPVKIANSRTIQIDRFVRPAEIDARYYDTPYYIAPRDETGLEAFAVICAAMRSQEMVGLARVVLARRERPIMIAPLGPGLCGTTLRYAHEVRSEAEYFADIPEIELPEEMVEVAAHIIRAKAADFDPALLEDRYRTVLASMLKEKHGDRPKKIGTATPSRQNVIDLMAALKHSLSQERTAAAKAAPRRTAAATAKRSPSKRARRA